MFEEKVKIPYFLVDYDMKLMPHYLFNLFIENSSRSSSKLGISNEKMLDLGYTWMIYRLKLEIKRLPKVNEEVFLSTRLSGWDRIKAYREHGMKDNEGNFIARASTVWTVVDIEKQKPVRIPKEIIDYYPLDGKANFRDFTKFKNQLMDKGDYRKIYKSDLDYNKHVNSVSTFRFLVDSNEIPYEKLREVEIYYKSQIYYRDKIKIASQGENEKFHQIICDDKILVQGTSKWVK